MSRAVLTLMAVTAELERDVIRERTTAGLEYARHHRTKSGKPIGRPRAVFRHDQVLQLHGEDLSGREIARRLGVGEATIRRQDASERRAKTPQRGLYEEPGTNPDHGGAEGLVNVVG